jgi:hypothetical protein
MRALRAAAASYEALKSALTGRRSGGSTRTSTGRPPAAASCPRPAPSFVAYTREDGSALRADPNPERAGRGAPAGAAARPPRAGEPVRNRCD